MGLESDTVEGLLVRSRLSQVAQRRGAMLPSACRSDPLCRAQSNTVGISAAADSTGGSAPARCQGSTWRLLDDPPAPLIDLEVPMKVPALETAVG